MKKKCSVVIVFLSLIFSGYASWPVNEHVLKLFNESFKEAKEVSWTESKDHYIVHFIKDDIRYNLTYDRKGNVVHSKRYYCGDKLPMYILFKVKRKFPEKSIYGVTEIMDENNVQYHITLEDKQNWWVIKITSEDFMEIVTKLMKI